MIINDTKTFLAIYIYKNSVYIKDHLEKILILLRVRFIYLCIKAH